MGARGPAGDAGRSLDRVLGVVEVRVMTGGARPEIRGDGVGEGAREARCGDLRGVICV